MPNKKSAKAVPIMDVSHPGTSAPHDNSKAVIINHRTIMDDPMVIKDKPKSDTMPTAPTLPAAHAKTVTPDGALSAPIDLEALEHKKKPKPEAEPEPVPEPELEPKKEAAPESVIQHQPVVEAKPDPEPEPLPDPEPKPETPKEDEEPSEVKPAEQPATQTNQEEEPETSKQAPEVVKLIDSHKYELPINSVEKRRSKHFIIAGIVLSIILALAWVNIALDAGLLQINGVKPVTHFFST